MEAIKFLRAIDKQANLGKVALVISGISTVVVLCVSYYYYNLAVSKQKDIIYIMDRNGTIQVARNVVTHDDQRLEYNSFIDNAITTFYNLEPDQKQIENSLAAALYKGEFKEMQEVYKQSDYYNSVIKRKIFQTAVMDSVLYSPDFREARYFGKLRIRYMTAEGIETSNKKLVLQFKIQKKTQRTENNPYGLYLTNIQVLDNSFIKDSGKSMAEEESLMPRETGF